MVFDALTPANALHDLLIFLPASRREEYRDVLADYSLFAIAINTLSCLIPTGDEAVEIFAENGIVRGLHDGCQHSQATLSGLALGYLDLQGDRLLLKQRKGDLLLLLGESR